MTSTDKMESTNPPAVEINQKKYKKWIIISSIIVILVVVNVTFFWQFYSRTLAERTESHSFTIISKNNADEGRDIEKIAVNVPQKIGSVNVIAGNMDQIEIKG